MRVTRPIVAAVLALGIAGSLVGCSTEGPLDNIVGGIVGDSVEQLKGEVEGRVSEALGGAQLTTDGTLPASFPAEVPLVEGTVLGGGAAPDNTGWVARVEVPSAGDFAEAQRLLEEAGFTGSSIDTDATSGFGNFASADHNVVLTVATDAGAVVATYVVTPR
ncbi:hypothetical protein [Salinibacterium sp. ZJ450]|uniref:hypothetical protein n=1 Tax=Salinibacterium sp. ZJ450 TaxID=2708338 RepID=UPI00141F9AF7|nr:hypothetical protein [Salinibacterium sp. ZJ450]